jgi:hypothetical protein
VRPFGPRSPERPRDDDEHPEWSAGYTEGFAAGVAAQPPRELYAATAVPWRVVRAQDVIEGEDGELYGVLRSGWTAGPDGQRVTWALTLACGTYRELIEGGPDDPARVLVSVALLDAVTLTGAALGARLIATRADPDGGSTGDLAWRGAG